MALTTDKSEHWLNVVFRDTPYEIPGVEGIILPDGTTAERPVGPAGPGAKLQNGLIRYNTDTNLLEAYVGGTWQNLISGNVPLIHVVATEANLAGIPVVDIPPPSPSDGEMATVLNNFGTNEEALYVWNSANSDLGAPLKKWRIIATAGFIPHVNQRNARITASSTTINIGDKVVIAANPMIKEINVDIIQVFDPGVALDVRGDTGNIIMGTNGSFDTLQSEINPQVVGTYTKKIPGVNLDPLDTLLWDDYILNHPGPNEGQITVQFSATGGGGVAQVYIKYIIQN